MNSILIVEDDEKLRTELGIFLGNNGYSIKYMDKFDNTISEILNSKCDLILLDINLPGCDGQYICTEQNFPESLMHTLSQRPLYKGCP